MKNYETIPVNFFNINPNDKKFKYHSITTFNQLVDDLKQEFTNESINQSKPGYQKNKAL